MHQVFTSWSGGKDSCFACYRASASGLKVRYLLNMITEDGKRSWSHGQPAELLQLQSKALGIPLIQCRTTRENYETEFISILHNLRQEGIYGGVFGDIDFNEHRQWIERVCKEANITPHLPLWEQNQDKIMRDFIDLGFKSVIVAAKADLFGEEWLGHEVDLDFLSELKQRTGITPCGEAGEYHTFVIDGPLFKEKIEILETNKVLREGRRFLEILKCELRAK
jgi:diphthine-ammonia ligase